MRKRDGFKVKIQGFLVMAESLGVGPDAHGQLILRVGQRTGILVRKWDKAEGGIRGPS